LQIEARAAAERLGEKIGKKMQNFGAGLLID
jgi:hypothetical protein